MSSKKDHLSFHDSQADRDCLVPLSPGAPSEHILIDPFLAEVMTASMTATKDAVDQVMDNYEATIAELRAELVIVRTNVAELCEKPYAPNPNCILAALWPARKQVAALAATSSATGS